MGKKVTVGYRYYMGLHFGLCHGPIDAIVGVLAGDRVAWSGSQAASGTIRIQQPNLFGGEEKEGGVDGNLDVLMGDASQTQNAYLLAKIGANVPAYRGIVTAVWRAAFEWRFGPIEIMAGGLVSCMNPYIKPWAFKVKRIQKGWASGTPWYSAKAAIGDDMNPAHIIYQCLTEPGWGMGYPVGSIDDASFTAAADTLYSESFGLSMAWNQQSTIEEFMKIVMDHAGGVIYVDPASGKFAIKLIRADFVKANLPLFTPSNVLRASDFQRQAWGETINEITVVYRDATLNKDSGVTVQDLANIATQGGQIISQTRQYPGISNASLAMRIAQRDLNTVSLPLARIRLEVNRQAWAVIPGAAIRVSWPDLGIDDVVFRVGEVDRGTLRDGSITLECVEDIFGMPQSTYIADQPTLWQAPNTAPANAAYRLLVEAPYWELSQRLSDADLAYITDTTSFVSAHAVRPSGDSIDFELWHETGPTYRLNGQFCPAATIAAPMVAEETTTASLSDAVDIDRVLVGSWAVIDSECMLVKAINAANGTIQFGRGVLDTVPASHALGARIFFVDGFGADDPTEYASGENVFLRILPKTGSGTLAYGSATSNAINVQRRQAKPYSPGQFRINGAAYPASLIGALTLAWAHRDRKTQTAYIVEQGSGNIGPEAGVTYSWDVRRASDNGILASASAVSGTSAAVPTLTYSGPIKLSVWSVRSNIESHQRHSHQIKYIPSAMAVSGTIDSTISQGVAYSFAMTTNVGQTPIAWSISAGALPDGLSLNASTGVISGTPTTAGSFSFTVMATDAQGFTGTKAFTAIQVTADPLILGTPPTAYIGQAYSFAPTTINVDAPITWSVTLGALPTWASLNASTGEITGTPTDATPATFTLQAAGATATATKEFTIAAYQLFIDFETDTGGFTGGWIRSTEWASVGSYSLRSGNYHQANTTSTSTLSTTLASAGTLTFDWRVESEACCDKLQIKVNGTIVVGPIGASPATGGSYSGAVPAGAFTLEVSYWKDGSVDTGLDGGFIDNIKIV